MGTKLAHLKGQKGIEKIRAPMHFVCSLEYTYGSDIRKKNY